jgi:hypothetical protein
MIVAERPAEQETPPNPLRLEGGYVVCPACGRRGVGWKWMLLEEPRHAPYTVPVYECRKSQGGCGHRFALKP